MQDVDDEEVPNNTTTAMEDLMPRTSIAAQITPELIAELADKNWKVGLASVN